MFKSCLHFVQHILYLAGGLCWCIHDEQSKHLLYSFWFIYVTWENSAICCEEILANGIVWTSFFLVFSILSPLTASIQRQHMQWSECNCYRCTHRHRPLKLHKHENKTKNKYIKLEQPFIEAIVFHFSIEMLSANVTYSFMKNACVCTMRKGKNRHEKNKKNDKEIDRDRKRGAKCRRRHTQT